MVLDLVLLDSLTEELTDVANREVDRGWMTYSAGECFESRLGRSASRTNTRDPSVLIACESSLYQVGQLAPEARTWTKGS